MADPTQPSQQDVSAGTSTVTTLVDDESQVDVPTLTVKLKKPKTDRKVKWTTETIDNEEMNKKKSKCCCIYKKPTQFGESSSSESSDEECDHCQGHVEKKKRHRPPHNHHDDSNGMMMQARSDTQAVIEALLEFPEVDGDRIEQPAT